MICEYRKSLLTAQERVAYERILAGIIDRKSTVSLGEIDGDRGMELYYIVCSDHPELFAASHQLSCNFYTSGWRPKGDYALGFFAECAGSVLEMGSTSS